MSAKSSIYVSLEKLLKNIGGSPHNIFISIGYDSQLTNLSYYHNLRSRISNDYPIVLIFFYDLSESPSRMLNNFSGDSYLKYVDNSTDDLKDNNLSIYLIPFNLPIVELGSLNDLLLYYNHSKVIFYEEGRNLRVKYNRNEMVVPKIDFSVCIDAFMNQDFMILLTQFCLHNIRLGCDIFLLNRYTLDTSGWFNNGGERPIFISGKGNIYLSKLVYFYPFISLLKNSGKFSIMIERGSKNYLDNFIHVLNLISEENFFSQNLDYLTRDWKDRWESAGDLIDSRYTNIVLQRNILTSNRASNITIPLSSFSTAFDTNWLDSYAIIVGSNILLRKFDMHNLNKVVVCIPEIQYELLKENGWNTLRNVGLLRDCEILFIPINISGIHWTLLMIDFRFGVGYHFDSLDEEEMKKHNSSKKIFDMNEEEMKKHNSSKKIFDMNKDDKKKHEEFGYNKKKHEEFGYNKKKHEESEYDKKKHEESGYAKKKHEESEYDKKKHEESGYDKKKHEESGYAKKKHEESNYHIANKICKKILNREVENIVLDDQYNNYDCGAFILLHLQILLNSYIYNHNFVEYLRSKIMDLNISMEIHKIRESIYSSSDDSIVLIEDLDKNKKKGKSAKRSIRRFQYT